MAWFEYSIPICKNYSNKIVNIFSRSQSVEVSNSKASKEIESDKNKSGSVLDKNLMEKIENGNTETKKDHSMEKQKEDTTHPRFLYQKNSDISMHDIWHTSRKKFSSPPTGIWTTERPHIGFNSKQDGNIK